MSTPLACIACNLDPQTTSLVLPLAQATVLAAPVILRAQLRKGVQALRSRRSRRPGAGGRAASPAPAAANPCREVDLDR